MPGTVLIYRVGTIEPEVIQIAGPKGLGLGPLQDWVGGPIETVPFFDRIDYEGKPRACVAFCHEEGKLIGLARNLYADRLWEKAMGQPVGGGRDYLVGNIVVVFGSRDFMAEL